MREAVNADPKLHQNNQNILEKKLILSGAKNECFSTYLLLYIRHPS